MPITYDIEKDYLYNKGIEKDIEKTTIDVIKNSRLIGLTVGQKANIIKLSDKQVQKILLDLKMN